MKSDKPTEKQINALRKFKISEDLIENMSFMDASNKLDKLIGDAKKRNPNYAGPKEDTNSGEVAPSTNDPASAHSTLHTTNEGRAVADSQTGHLFSTALPTKEVDAINRAALKLVMDMFHLNSVSELTDAHISLVTGTAQRLYSLKYWVSK